MLQFLASHGFHGIAPDFSKFHSLGFRGKGAYRISQNWMAKHPIRVDSCKLLSHKELIVPMGTEQRASCIDLQLIKLKACRHITEP